MTQKHSVPLASGVEEPLCPHRQLRLPTRTSRGGGGRRRIRIRQVRPRVPAHCWIIKWTNSLIKERT